MCSVVRHGQLYKLRVTWPKVQIEGSCNVHGRVKADSFNETCSLVETFSERKCVALISFPIFILPIETNIWFRFDADNVTGKVKVRFSHIPDRWQAQTDHVDAKIKHEKANIKLYDRANNHRILSMHISHFHSDFLLLCFLHHFFRMHYNFSWFRRKQYYQWHIRRYQ